ncbi:hypothetical protein UFOVP29_378 [uncultured Caudovirales phage]|uniref:Uncharacterized protein n=1 Tax=uncultured Caudovirales phage TaxID=2100421 RepID=A0A6J5KSP1_9CAUD|nr:hypothetical protein UFOVP29_378 [uncultured Caudovirales phage]
MNNPADYREQLTDLTVRLCGMVAERISYATENLERNERRRINRMIEDDLPNVISNTIAKTPSLHSSQGVQYMEKNLNAWADDWTKKFLGAG